jgi:thiol-disulfide isomerase/thioredoxin
MNDREPAPPPRLGRKPLSARGRAAVAALLALAVATAVVVGVVLAVAPPEGQRRITTLPVADRDASPELVRAAEAVGFLPPRAPGAGEIETAPATAARTPSNDGLLPVGRVAPEFALRTPKGDRVSLRDLRGKAVLLEFFATWCPHCAAEAPHLAELHRSLPKSKYAFVSIDAGGADAASVFAYHVYFGLPFPAVLDPEPGAEPATFPAHGTTGPVSRAYRVEFLPTFYVLDRQGRITWRGDGEQPNALLRQELERAASA